MYGVEVGGLGLVSGDYVVFLCVGCLGVLYGNWIYLMEDDVG